MCGSGISGRQVWQSLTLRIRRQNGGIRTSLPDCLIWGSIVLRRILEKEFQNGVWRFLTGRHRKKCIITIRIYTMRRCMSFSGSARGKKTLYCLRGAVQREGKDFLYTGAETVLRLMRRWEKACGAAFR